MPKESFEQKQNFNIESALEKIPTVSEVERIELDSGYFEWAKENLNVQLLENIKSNYSQIQAIKFNYLSDNLKIPGFIWAPKNLNQPLPKIIWNRGGTGTYGSYNFEERKGLAYFSVSSNIPCELAKNNAIVLASQYRGGIGAEGKDEWGGKDLDDVIELNKIADKLPMCDPGKSIVAGKSRGGMMNYLLAAKEPWVKGVISIAGEVDLKASAEIDSDFHRDIFVPAFGGSYEEMRKRSAVDFYMEIPKDLPILILQGDADDRVHPEPVRKFVNLLEKSSHDVEYHEFAGAGHELGNIDKTYGKEVSDIIQKFLISINKR
jgi:dipeptidyl aminopeptidase/acylaminoacyl peptidase